MKYLKNIIIFMLLIIIIIINSSCSFINNFENILPYKTCEIEKIYDVIDNVNLDILQIMVL